MWVLINVCVCVQCKCTALQWFWINAQLIFIYRTLPYIPFGHTSLFSSTNGVTTQTRACVCHWVCAECLSLPVLAACFIGHVARSVWWPGYFSLSCRTHTHTHCSAHCHSGLCVCAISPAAGLPWWLDCLCVYVSCLLLSTANGKCSKVCKLVPSSWTNQLFPPRCFVVVHFPLSPSLPLIIITF